MSDELERLEAMIEPNQQTWDLSRNDVAAIRWAVERLNATPAPGPATAKMLKEARYRLDRRYSLQLPDYEVEHLTAFLAEWNEHNPAYQSQTGGTMNYDPSFGCDDSIVQSDREMAAMAANKELVERVVVAILGSEPLMARIVNNAGPTVDTGGNCIETASRSRARAIVDQAIEIVASIVAKIGEDQ